MSKPFLGKGLSFPITTLDNVGNLKIAEYEESVRQSVLIILGTAKGERVMRPDFGCGIYDLVFELNTPTTIARIIQEVQDALLKFEPRIDVVDVQVNQEADKLLISINYQIRTTNNVFNLVYPFYLERSPG